MYYSRNRQAWRIVLPALLFFTIMVIISLYYSIILDRTLYNFCMEFRAHLNLTDLPCGMLMNHFAINNTSTVMPSCNYAVSQTFSWITVVLWLIALIIMIVRCVFVIDFELVQVVIYEVHLEKLTPDTSQLSSSASNETKNPPIVVGNIIENLERIFESFKCKFM